jgi:serine/threonine protein kinase/CheY-like chemotaxis protein
MQRSQLLIVDGESLRTPALVQALEREGWEVVWCREGGAHQALTADRLPDLLLFDPATVTPEGLGAVAFARMRKAGLPVVALGAPGQDEARLTLVGLDPAAVHRLGRNLGPDSWPATLRSCMGGFGPGAQKFTAEDLFGDILADMEELDELPSIPMEPLPPPVPPLPAPAIPMQVPESLDPYVPPAAPPVSAFPEASPDLGLEEFGNYYLLEKVAVGGMAELFKARQRGVHNFEKIVAIKRILPHLSDNDEFVRMFIDEAKLAAQLTHPNIVQIFDLGKAGGFYYIAMEFVDGRDLRSLLRKVREYKLPLPEAVAAAVTMKVANALDYAHRERGINDRELKLVHRDISPQNILISYDGAVKLVDFGIAKAATKSTQTMAGALKGKLLYMSPEQALGQHLDGRSDIYSLGLVLFELLTGERCFQADNELGVLEKVRLGKVQDVRQVNPAVSLEMAAILDKVLQKNVEQRYASARLLERDLKALLVKRGNEPTEHDVAEYVNTLLKGTREDLETLLAAQFPLPAPRETPKPARPATPVREPVPPPVALLPRQPLPQRPPDGAIHASKQPMWFIPAMALLGLAVVALAWFILR